MDLDAPMQGAPDAPPPPGPCTGATSCPIGQVCNPANHMCTGSLGCTTHSDCGAQAYCQPNGMCAVNVPHGLCDNDQNCVGQEHCDNGRCGCGGQLLGAVTIAPNVLIAIDRSASMNEVIGPGQPTKWNIAKTAIKNLTNMYNDRIRFGLELWPGKNLECTTGGTCVAGAVFVDVGPGTATMIASKLDDPNTMTCHFMTPIAATLNDLVAYPGLGDATRSNYVLLVTDGEENCKGDPGAAATALRGRTPEVKTFVIGFGGQVNAAQLNDIATKGGTDRTGTTKYYQADDAAGLESAFNTIVGSVVSCSYTLSQPPASPDRLYIYFGTTLIPRDTSHAMGWDYDPVSMSLTFYGSTCNQIKAGTAGNLVVSYGCPVIP
ncbi:MAG TPA: VWA domain-containing protein [Haliangiales bacterium]|nr:VWA domain-containing protein [Haliangiales bacterium]